MKLYDLVQWEDGKEKVLMTDTFSKVSAKMGKLRKVSLEIVLYLRPHMTRYDWERDLEYEED